MKHRLFVTLAIIFPFLIFFVPANQTIAVNEKNHNPNTFESLTEISNYHELTNISDPLEPEEAFGRIVPNECLTSNGMLVEGTSSTGAYSISTFFAPSVLIILAGIILLKKSVMK